MAYTEIHGIKATVNKAIEYICNPDKTDEQIYVSSFACSPETAALDFQYTLDHTGEHSFVNGQDRENKAFHLIQAFAPGEVSFDEAHAVGKELAEQLLGGRYSYVLTTHIDKGHVHNHLIFCAADNMEYKHYHDCKKTYWNIRKLSDKLCQEHGLSVIESSKKRGAKYNEWSANQSDQGWKNQIRKDINQVIKSVSSYDEFLALMQAKGYEMKNTSFEENSGKYIAFRPLDKDRFVRGSAKSLGKNFTRERIKERIEKKRTLPFNGRPANERIKKLIDTSADERFVENVGLRKWANKENLRIASDTYNRMVAKNIHNFSELNQRILFLQEESKTTNSSIVNLEHQLRDLAETIKYAEQYQENKSFHDRYRKVKDPDRFLRKYESHLILFAGAERMLQHKNIDTSHLPLEKIKTQYQELLSKKKELSNQYKSSQSEIKELETIKENMEQYLGKSSIEGEHSAKKTMRDI